MKTQRLIDWVLIGYDEASMEKHPNMILKRTFDFVTAFMALLLLSPVFVVIALMIKIITPGPVFFSQKRVGQHAEIFTLYKFRTMSVDHKGSTITVKGEHRITPLGAFLRKYKLDELPGFWNILRGEMSLVGPRPDVPGYADMLNPQDRVILDLKPGLTGPATMKYSNEEEMLARQADPAEYNDRVIYPDKVRINKHYIENWSFLLDLKIIIYTVLGKKLKDKWSQ